MMLQPRGARPVLTRILWPLGSVSPDELPVWNPEVEIVAEEASRVETAVGHNNASLKFVHFIYTLLAYFSMYVR